MIVSKPEKMNEAFAKVYNSGDLNALLDLYETTAIHVSKEDEHSVGVGKIKNDLQKLLDLSGQMTSTNLSTVVHDDIALLQAQFVLRDSTGESILAEGITSEVIRKQLDGSWNISSIVRFLNWYS